MQKFFQGWMETLQEKEEILVSSTFYFSNNVFKRLLSQGHLKSGLCDKSHWLLCHITIVETMNSSKRGKNPVTMIIINPWKEFWLSWKFEPVTYSIVFYVTYFAMQAGNPE